MKLYNESFFTVLYFKTLETKFLGLCLHYISFLTEKFWVFLASWINLNPGTNIGLIKCHLSEKQNNKIAP